LVEDFRRIIRKKHIFQNYFKADPNKRKFFKEFSWQQNVKQEIGLYISKNYKTLEDSFYEISNKAKFITFT